MRIDQNIISRHNDSEINLHTKKVAAARDVISNAEYVIEKLKAFQIAIPSWALGTGGTRFGRFAGAGEPGTLEEKIDDMLRSKKQLANLTVANGEKWIGELSDQEIKELVKLVE